MSYRRINKFIIVTTTVFTFSVFNFSFALTPKQSNCSFPHKFKITGPSNIHINKVERVEYEMNNVSVENANMNSFDVVQVNGSTCMGGAIRLNVGIDDTHWTEIVMVDSDKKITVVSSGQVNGFHLYKFDESNRPNILIDFEQN